MNFLILLPRKKYNMCILYVYIIYRYILFYNIIKLKANAHEPRRENGALWCCMMCVSNDYVHKDFSIFNIYVYHYYS